MADSPQMTVSYTFLRHRMLADTAERAICRPNRCRDMTGPERRAMGQLRDAGLLNLEHEDSRAHTRCLVSLSDAGKALLAEWNSQHEEVTS